MTAQEFVNKIKNISATKEQLNSLGFTGVHNDNIWRQHNLELKAGSFIEQGDELLNLIKNYKIEGINIREISFYSEIEEDADNYYVGTIDVYLLAINKKNKTLLALDLTDDLSYCFDCAKDSSSFLDALYYAMEYMIYKLTKVIERNELNTNDYRTKCTIAAGGIKYSDLFTQILVR